MPSLINTALEQNEALRDEAYKAVFGHATCCFWGAAAMFPSP